MEDLPHVVLAQRLLRSTPLAIKTQRQHKGDEHQSASPYTDTLTRLFGKLLAATQVLPLLWRPCQAGMLSASLNPDARAFSRVQTYMFTAFKGLSLPTCRSKQSSGHDGTVHCHDDVAGCGICALGPVRHRVPARGAIDLHLAVRPRCASGAGLLRYLPSQPYVRLCFVCGLRHVVCRLPQAGTQPTAFTNSTLTNAVSGVVSANGFPSGINNIQVQ